MDAIDLALLTAWRKRFGETWAAARQPYAERPLRSWALVLRAGDKRLIPGLPITHPRAESLFGTPEDPTGELARWKPPAESLRKAMELPPKPGRMRNAAELLPLEGAEVRALCGPVNFTPPGMSMTDATKMLGVGANTIKRWAKRGVLKLTPIGKWDTASPLPRKFPRLRYTLVTARGSVDPSGQVWSMPWGDIRRSLHEKVGDDFYQEIVRVRRVIGAQGGMWQWVCPGCGTLAFKLYLPIRVWTMQRWFGSEDHLTMDEREAESNRRLHSFVCRRCAGLVYESAERRRGEGDGRREWDLFVKRFSGGALRGREVERPE
jgi:hypothetical protein